MGSFSMSQFLLLQADQTWLRYDSLDGRENLLLCAAGKGIGLGKRAFCVNHFTRSQGVLNPTLDTPFGLRHL
jgi:hypothetical protein